MRLVVIDTETTGLFPQEGDKLVEIAGIAIENNQIQMDQTFHSYIDPLREIPKEVIRIHHIDAAKLKEESATPFAEAGRAFREFIADATLVAHNAAFDLAFIKKELAETGLPDIDDLAVIDTLAIAGQIFPNEPRKNTAALQKLLSIDVPLGRPDALSYATTVAQIYLAMQEQTESIQQAEPM